MATATRSYRGGKYWENEMPKEVETERLRLRHFLQAGKLQFQQAWSDRNGERHYGKVITLDFEDMATSPEARALLSEFME